MPDQPTQPEDLRVADLTTVTLAHGTARPGGQRVRVADIPTADLPRLLALLDELDIR